MTCKKCKRKVFEKLFLKIIFHFIAERIFHIYTHRVYTRVLTDSRISRPLKIDPKNRDFFLFFLQKLTYKPTTFPNVATVKCLNPAVCINKEFENDLGEHCLR